MLITLDVFVLTIFLLINYLGNFFCNILEILVLVIFQISRSIRIPIIFYFLRIIISRLIPRNFFFLTVFKATILFISTQIIWFIGFSKTIWIFELTKMFRLGIRWCAISPRSITTFIKAIQISRFSRIIFFIIINKFPVRWFPQLL